MPVPFGEPEPSDALLSKSVSSTRLRAWLTMRLRQLASAQRIQPLDGKNTTSTTVYNWGELLHYVNLGPITPLGWSHPRQS